MFSEHTYLSGITKTLNEHFKNVALDVDSRFFSNLKQKSVLDIGSNDGTQLKPYKDLGYEVLGVESAKTPAKIAMERGIETINEFFNYDLAKRINKKFNVINAAGVFFHLEELHSVTEGIRKLLDDKGVFVIQFLYMKKIVENVAFDQIYHEHLLYYNLKTLQTLLEKHGLSIFDAYESPIHGGSIIAYVTHIKKLPPSNRFLELIKCEEFCGSNELKTYVKFAKKIEKLKSENLVFLINAKQNGKRIFGMGAPAKGNTLLNYFGITTRYLDCLVERNPLRKGLYSPGSHIPIVLESELQEIPDIYYVLAWNYKNEILENNKRLLEKGVRFYFPISRELV